MPNILDNIGRWCGSKLFFRLVLGFFILESSWIAISAVYPQAFDENFHFGLIQVYSHVWLPFFANQPPHAAAYGAVARDPSYLYHYLMSFPYRLVALFVHGQTAQVIILRLLNVGLFASSLVLFRRLLMRTGLSRALAQISLLLFVLIPIVPQLAGQINYDNLLLPLVAWFCLLAFRAIDEVRQGRPSARSLVMLLSLGLVTSLVQYEFLPIFVATVLFLVWVTWRAFRGKVRQLCPLLVKSWRAQRRLAQVLLLIAVVVSVGLFAQRDGLNLVRYHTLAPDCGRVLNTQSCSAYSVWNHDHQTHLQVQQHLRHVNNDPLYYLAVWPYWLIYRLFFVVNGPAHGFKNWAPLPLPIAAFVLLLAGGLAVLIRYWRRIFAANPYLSFLGFASLLYLAALLMEGYLKYRATDVLELMNGRYLLPIIPFGMAIIGTGFGLALRTRPRVKAILAILAIVLFLDGGGVFSFIARSDSSWDWPNNRVVQLNDTARRIIGPLVVNGSKSYGTSHWFFN